MSQTNKEKGETKMKRRIFSMVFVVILTLSLCACGNSGPHPLSVDFQSEDELVTALETFFRSDWGGETEEDFAEALKEVREVLKANTAIHHYFQESDEAIALAHRLCSDGSIGDVWAWVVFDSCNTSEWYAGIEATEYISYPNPLFFVGWHYDRPTFASVADAIRHNFKDPLSVSVLNGEWSFIKPVDGYFEGPLNYVGIVEVRATNSFGGYITQKYVIEGKIRGEIKLIKEYTGSPDFISNVDWNFYERYNAQASFPNPPIPMEAENSEKLPVLE